MAFRYSPKIITDGLVLALDAANKKSYPGSGTSIQDLSGNSNNGVLTNGPTFNSANNGSIVFDGTNDYISLPYSEFTSAPMLTIEAWFNKDTNTNFQTLLSLRGPNSPNVKVLVALNTNGTIRLDSASTTAFLILYGGDVSYTTSLGRWYHVAASIDYNTQDWAVYLNGEQIDSGNNPTIRGYNTFGVDNFQIARNNIIQHMDGKVGATRVYNRVLSSQEILQNYNAIKSRFGL